MQLNSPLFNTLDPARQKIALDRAVARYKELREGIPQELLAMKQELLRRQLLEMSHMPPVFRPLLEKRRYKGAHGGRGSAKSHTFAELLLRECLLTRTRAVCIREHQVSLEQSVKRLLEDKIEAFQLGKYFRILDTEIHAPQNGIIIFQGMKNHTADSIKSLEGYRIGWVEEAQSLSEKSLRLLRPTLRTPGSELWFTWNPRNSTDPVDKMLRSTDSKNDPDICVVEANYSDNPYLPDELRKEMERDRRRDPELYNHIWLGQYERKSEARVFKNWKIEEFEAPSDTLFYYGADWGYSTDPAVLVRFSVNGRTLYIDHEAYQVGCEIDHLPQLFDKVPGARSWVIRADNARPETISYMKRHGYPRMEASTKGKDSVKEGIIFLQSYDIVVHPRCTNTIDELTKYAYKTDPLTGDPTPVLEDKKNHVIDSLRYAAEKLRKGETWATW